MYAPVCYNGLVIKPRKDDPMSKKIKILIASLLVLISVAFSLAIVTSASADYDATLTITANGVTETHTGTLMSMRNKVNTVLSSPSVKTECVLTLNRDTVVDVKYPTFTANTNTNAHLTIDLNGYDLHYTNTENASSLVSMFGIGSLTIDGEGEGGDIGTLTYDSMAGLIYTKNSTDSVVTIKNVNFVFNGMALGFADNNQYPHQPMFNLQTGDVTLANVHVTYTGKYAVAVAGSTGGTNIADLHPPFIQANGSADIKINNCEFIDTNTKGIKTYGIYAVGASTVVTVTNSKLDAYHVVNQSQTRQVVSFTDCELSATNAIFSGVGKVGVTDSIINLDGCAFTASGITAEFSLGDGDSYIYASSLPTQGYTVPEDHAFILSEDGKYRLMSTTGYPTVSLPAYYQNGMVFQRGETITVKGFCKTNGNTVTATLGDLTATATVSDGEWSLELPAMEATTGLTLTVTENEPENTYPLVFEDVAIGDVFILSGQSNMDYQTKYLEDYQEYLANANSFNNLRGYLVPNAYRHGEDEVGSGTWYKLNEKTIGNFSAIGYVMATKIAAELDDVTIAIVDATYPGSIAKTWIDIDTYIEHFGENHTDVNTYKDYLAFYEKNGRCPTSTSELGTWIGKSYQRVVASCYDSMIAFFDGYSAKATIWYQGEGDLSRVSEYPAYHKALTESFRKTFNNDEMAFVVIQLAPYSAGGTSLQNFRVMQATLPTIDPYTYVVATSNEGAVYNDPEFINNSDISLVFVHTSVKSPIGLNAADTVLSKIYNVDGANLPLEIVNIEKDGQRVVITFNQPVVTGGVDEILGFELAGSNGSFVQADALIDGDKVILTANGVTNPTKVRYGYGSFYIEYQDGTIVVPVGGYSGGSMTSTTITFKDTDGNTHTITRDADEVLRSCIPGNVTSETGAPLGVFSIEIE